MPPQMRTNVPINGRAPWTRRTALALWSRCVGALSLVATGAIALGVASQGIESEDDVQDMLLGLGLVLALPTLWIALTRFAEKRYLARPPKRFLAAALGLAVGGIALVAAAVALPLTEPSQVASIFRAGGALEALGTVLLLLWYAVIRVVAPTSDHMHAL